YRVRARLAAARALPRGSRAGLRARRPARCAGDARRGAADRRPDRDCERRGAPLPPLADPVQLPLEPRRRTCRERALRLRRWPPDGARARRPSPGRGDGAALRLRLPAGDRLARTAARLRRRSVVASALLLAAR